MCQSWNDQLSCNSKEACFCDLSLLGLIKALRAVIAGNIDNLEGFLEEYQSYYQIMLAFAYIYNARVMNLCKRYTYGCIRYT